MSIADVLVIIFLFGICLVPIYDHLSKPFIIRVDTQEIKQALDAITDSQELRNFAVTHGMEPLLLRFSDDEIRAEIYRMYNLKGEKS